MSNKEVTNPYIPLPVTIDKIIIENDVKDLKTFRFIFSDTKDAASFKYKCGQFALLSVPGAGECPIGIASSPLDEGYLEFTVKKYPEGIVTTALHSLEEGSRVGIRGPYGNSFPLEEMKDRNIVIVGGGFAFTTLRSTIRYMLNKEIRQQFKNITLIYGARNPGELLYKQELKEWEGRNDIDVVLTVDKGDKNWKGREGFVPSVVKEVAPGTENATVLICGPPIMLKFTILPLLEMGFEKDKVFTSLERKMSCGLGKCGKCNICSKYVCKDGPVFSCSQIQELMEAII